MHCSSSSSPSFPRDHGYVATRNSQHFSSAAAIGHHPDAVTNSCRLPSPYRAVWSFVRRFDEPQNYKPFVSRCVVQGNLEIGSLREVYVKSGLPATTSTERLEFLHDEEHVLRFKIIGGDHRLRIRNGAPIK